jgi:hypothetical protein
VDVVEALRSMAVRAVPGTGTDADEEERTSVCRGDDLCTGLACKTWGEMG